MVNSRERVDGSRLRLLAAVLWAYVVVAAASALALVTLSVTAPRLAPQEAWVHGVIVAVLAGLLPLRLRTARHGSRAALRAVGIICAVLLLANVVVALLPHFLPAWMRVEATGIVVLMAIAVWLVARAAVAGRTQTRVAAGERSRN